MTYCLAIQLETGIVFASDSRTNAGADQISTYSKMYEWGVPGERQFVFLSAGNLATTQVVMTQIRRDIEQGSNPNLANVKYMSEAAEYLGSLSVRQQSQHTDQLTSGDFNPEATFIIGGQIKGEAPMVYLVYPQGNYITVPDQTPFLQIGETKYGKPILRRIIRRDTSIEDAIQCAMVSMDSTMVSNVTVGPPVELLIYTPDSLTAGRHRRFEADDPYLLSLKDAWKESLIQAVAGLPTLDIASLTPRASGQ